MEGFQLPSGTELAHFTQPDGTIIKTLELSRDFFEEDEHGVEVFARAVNALNDEDGMILDEASCTLCKCTTRTDSSTRWPSSSAKR